MADERFRSFGMTGAYVLGSEDGLLPIPEEWRRPLLGDCDEVAGIGYGDHVELWPMSAFGEED